MDIATAQKTMLRTHIAALANKHRPNGIFLESGPGVGKSDGTRQLCEMIADALNEPVALVVEMMATYSSVDVRGYMLPVKGDNGMDTMWSIPSWYPKRANIEVVEPGGKWTRLGKWTGEIPRVGILFLDEFSQAEDEVKKPAAELIYKGRVGTTELPIEWRVIAAGNRTSDRSGVMRELMFIVNRRCKLSITPSLPAWIAWANRQPSERRPHYLTISFAQKNPDIVFRDTTPEGTEQFCTPRSLCLLDQDLMSLRSEQDKARDRLPIDDIAREVAEGWIGGAAAAQFFTHLKYADELPDIDDIEKDPDKAKLPDERSAQMVCAYMLAHHVSEGNAGSILKYITRLNIEMQALAMNTLMAPQDHKSKAVAAHPLFMSWLMKHKDLLVASWS